MSVLARLAARIDAPVVAGEEHVVSRGRSRPTGASGTLERQCSRGMATCWPSRKRFMIEPRAA